jgi:hypothetical protein
MAKNKTPKNQYNPPLRGKVARHEETNASVATERFRWTFKDADTNGPYTILGSQVDHLVFDLIGKLQEYESMHWADVEGPTGSHFVPVENFSPDAQRRLEEINQNDVESLFSLRMKGKERLWGLRDRAVLRLIWWDPDHAVCPSFKKHT